jgi:hypothetical protein
MGYFVDFMVDKSNHCRDLHCLNETALVLNVSVDSAMMSFSVIQPENDNLPVERDYYDIFVLLGSSKVPHLGNPAGFGIYICQFPFDLAAKIETGDIDRLKSFQQVWLNSQHSLKFYCQHLIPFVTQEQIVRLPTAFVVYPPVKMREGLYARIAETERKHILMIVFKDRQSKGNEIAIHVFELLRAHNSLPNDTNLILIGTLAPNRTNHWAEKLRKLGEGQPIRYLFNTRPEEIENAYRTSSVFWQVTEVQSYGELDPASIEHFGINLVEAMSTGLIPVVSAGVAEEIMDSSCGFNGSHATDFMKLTADLFKLPTDKLKEYRNNAMFRARSFSVERFSRDIYSAITRGLNEKEFRKHMYLVPAQPNALTEAFPGNQKFEFAAVIVEPRLHYALKLITKNMLTILGKEWKVIIYHSEANEAFVQSIFHGVSPSRFEFHLVEQRESPILSYNRLLYSEEFWLPLIKFNRILLFQTDSFLIRKFPAYFLKYDYVGAPWCSSNKDLERVMSSPLFQNQSSTMPQTAFVGNGGLSLRNPLVSLECIRDLHGNLPMKPKLLNDTHRIETPLGKEIEEEERDELLNEDVYFVSCILSKSKKIPSKEIASSFAVEVPCFDIPAQVSGLHALWYYMSAEKFSKFMKKQLPQSGQSLN